MLTDLVEWYCSPSFTALRYPYNSDSYKVSYLVAAATPSFCQFQSFCFKFQKMVNTILLASNGSPR